MRMQMLTFKGSSKKDVRIRPGGPGGLSKADACGRGRRGLKANVDVQKLKKFKIEDNLLKKCLIKVMMIIYKSLYKSLNKLLQIMINSVNNNKWAKICGLPLWMALNRNKCRRP